MSNGFVAAKVSSCCQLDVEDNRLAQPLCSGRITGLHRSYGLVRPCAPHWYARLVVVATWTSPLASERQVPAVPHESPDQTRASYTPVAIRPVSRWPSDFDTNAHHRRLFTAAAWRGLEPAPGSGLRRAFLHLSCSLCTIGQFIANLPFLRLRRTLDRPVLADGPAEDHRIVATAR